MRKNLHRGTIFGCALALLLCATAWLAPAAFASDSIYWSSYTNGGPVRVGDLGGSGARDLFTGESSPEGVAIDLAAGKVYWADTTSGTIRVGNLDGTGARDLYTGESQPSGVAIDPAAGLIYWADAVSGSGAIRVGNLDGSGTARTLFAGESYPVGLTIDPAAGTIYWGSYDTFKIRVGNLNGTGARDLFSGENYPTQLAIDPAAGKIYWTNEFNGNVRVGNLDGTGARSLYTGEGEIGGVAVDPTTAKIYWTNWNLGTIRVGSLDGTVPPQSLYTGQANAWMVALLRTPLGTGAPQVSGTGAIGQPLSCTPGSWAPDLLSAFLYRAPQTRAYQWTLNGSPIAGATASSVLVSSPGDYRCAEIATNVAGSTTQTSAPTTVSPSKPPAPLLGRLVNAKPVGGKVFEIIKGRLVQLTGETQIHTGALIDALHGTVSLTSATGRGEKTQTGNFGGAVFKLTQARAGKNKGLTTLKLVEGGFKGAPTYASCKARKGKPHKKALDATAAAASRTLQLLRSSAHGKFQTRGRYSAATVRGTKWTIADRCDGTLTHDITHSVAVTDFVRHKTIILHAGQSYLAKKRK
jgi:PQQ-like domain